MVGFDSVLQKAFQEGEYGQEEAAGSGMMVGERSKQCELQTSFF
jgi:hypothetical protein